MNSDSNIINSMLMISIVGFWFAVAGIKGGGLCIYFVGGSLLLYLIGLFAWNVWKDTTKSSLPEGYKESTLFGALSVGLIASIVVYLIVLHPR